MAELSHLKYPTGIALVSSTVLLNPAGQYGIGQHVRCNHETSRLHGSVMTLCKLMFEPAAAKQLIQHADRMQALEFLCR
jgi:hypothetical protein